MKKSVKRSQRNNSRNKDINWKNVIIIVAIVLLVVVAVKMYMKDNLLKSPPNGAISTPSSLPKIIYPCTDSDGFNVREQGHVIVARQNFFFDFSYKTYEDYCDGSNVVEFYCKHDAAQSLKIDCKQLYPGGLGCLNGKCVDECVSNDDCQTRGGSICSSETAGCYTAGKCEQCGKDSDCPSGQKCWGCKCESDQTTYS